MNEALADATQEIRAEDVLEAQDAVMNAHANAKNGARQLENANATQEVRAEDVLEAIEVITTGRAAKAKAAPNPNATQEVRAEDVLEAIEVMHAPRLHAPPKAHVIPKDLPSVEILDEETGIPGIDDEVHAPPSKQAFTMGPTSLPQMSFVAPLVEPPKALARPRLTDRVPVPPPPAPLPPPDAPMVETAAQFHAAQLQRQMQHDPFAPSPTSARPEHMSISPMALDVAENIVARADVEADPDVSLEFFDRRRIESTIRVILSRPPKPLLAVVAGVMACSIAILSVAGLRAAFSHHDGPLVVAAVPVAQADHASKTLASSPVAVAQNTVAPTHTPDVSSSPTTSIESLPAAPATGTIVRGARVKHLAIDGVRVTDASTTVACGQHAVKIGWDRARRVTVPCGGGILVESGRVTQLN